MIKLENQKRRCVDQRKRHQVGTWDQMCCTQAPKDGGNATLKWFFIPDAQQRSWTTNRDRFWWSGASVVEKIGWFITMVKTWSFSLLVEWSKLQWRCRFCTVTYLFTFLICVSSIASSYRLLASASVLVCAVCQHHRLKDRERTTI